MQNLLNIMLKPTSLILLGVVGFFFFFALDRLSKPR